MASPSGSTAGTAGDTVANGGLQNGGFEKTERTVDGTAPNAGCPVGHGAVSAVVLSFTMPITLQTEGTATVLALEVAGTDGDTGAINFQDGCVGSGQPVANVATIGGGTEQYLCAQAADISARIKLVLRGIGELTRLDRLGKLPAAPPKQRRPQW